MNPFQTLRSMRPTLQLLSGRLVGFVVAFAIPMVLVRVLDTQEIGTYRLLFLIYGTLLSLAQLGMAESLYYFVPQRPAESGRWVGNAVATLAVVGVALGLAVAVAAPALGARFNNPQLAELLPMLGIVLGLMLTATVFEIAMVCRQQYRRAAVTYGASDLLRALLLTLPALVTGRLDALVMGAVVFALVRVVVAAVYLRREFGSSLGVGRQLWSSQLAYALPFAAAVAVELAQINFHQYAVALWFDPATFAIYSIGCLQIPLVDLLANSSANVMMVSMSDRIGKGQSPLPLWHETVERLAFVFFPMVAVLMLTATDLIVALYTPAYAASAPIFMVSIAFIVLAAFPADAVLRVYAETRTLLVLNIFRLVFIAGAIGAFVAQFQLRGAVLVTLTSAVIAKGLAMVRCGSLMGTSAATLLPWRSLAGIGVAAALAVVPAWLVKALMPGGGLLAASVTASVYGLSYLAVVSLGSLVRAAAAPAVVEGTCAE